MPGIDDLDKAGLTVVPASVELEQSLLGLLLTNNDAFRRVVDTVKTEHFHFEPHRKIFDATAALINAGRVASPATLKTYLGDLDLGGVSPVQYLFRIAAESTTVINALDYAKGVRELHDRRLLIERCQATIALAYNGDPSTTAGALIEEHQNKIEAIRPAASNAAPEYVTLATAVAGAIEMASKAHQRQGGLAGLSTGYPALDDALGGLQNSDMIIIAGRPGSGKTSLATNIAFNAARKFHDDKRAGVSEGGVVGFFSMEMSAEQLAGRILSEQSAVPGWKVRRGNATNDQIERYIMVPRDSDAREVMLSRGFLIDQRGGLSLHQVVRRAREWKKKGGLDLIVIDYLQLMGGSESRRRNDNRVQELTDITSGLKALAKELNVPIIALSQLSRQVEQRDNKRPMMADLRESGSIEQDADVILMIYREEYYLRQMIPQEGTEARMEWEKALARAEGVAEVNIAKQRHGPPGTVVMGFDANLTRFLNAPPPREEQQEPEQRERKKKPTLSDKTAISLYGVLRGMTTQRSQIATPEQRSVDRELKKGARLVRVDELRQSFGEQVLGPEGEDEVRVKTEFTRAFKHIHAAGLARYSKQGDDWLVWIPDMVAED